MSGKSIDHVWRQISHSSINYSLLANRSDHATVARNGDLYIFGGLYTDVAEGTIYIMKDFLRMSLPAHLKLSSSDGIPSGSSSNRGGLSSASALRATTERLNYGPSWRFDHTMVLAPVVGDPTGRGSSKLRNAPVLYGGGGGADVFSDIWVYDASSRSWFEIAVQNETFSGASIMTSLLFGTVGFATFTCIIVCLFMRKLAQRNTQDPLADLEQGGTVQIGRLTFRGIPQGAIDVLPRVRWTAELALDVDGIADSSHAELPSEPPPPYSGTLANDTASSQPGNDLRVEECCSGPSEDTPSHQAYEIEMEELSKPPEKAADDASSDSGELCAVCLCDYVENDVLIRLPCSHLFHEGCITRWLKQDRSCPHCRFNVMSAVRSRRGSRDNAVPHPQISQMAISDRANLSTLAQQEASSPARAQQHSYSLADAQQPSSSPTGERQAQSREDPPAAVEAVEC